MRIGAARKAIRDRKRLLSELSMMLMVIRLLFSHSFILFFIFSSLSLFSLLTLRGLFYFHCPVRPRTLSSLEWMANAAADAGRARSERMC